MPDKCLITLYQSMKWKKWACNGKDSSAKNEREKKKHISNLTELKYMFLIHEDELYYYEKKFWKNMAK